MRRIVLDSLMLVTMLLLMGFQYLPKPAHEVLGIVLLLVTAVHLWLNRTFWTALLRGRWPIRRTVSTVLNMGLLISILLVVVTGIVISNHLFKGLIPLAMQRNLTVHQLHVGVVYYLLIFMGVHLGLHIGTWWARLRSKLGIMIVARRAKVMLYIAILAIAAFGVYGAVQNQLLDRLALKHIFATAATRGTGAEYFAYLVSMLALFVMMGQILNRILSKR